MVKHRRGDPVWSPAPEPFLLPIAYSLLPDLPDAIPFFITFPFEISAGRIVPGLDAGRNSNHASLPSA